MTDVDELVEKAMKEAWQPGRDLDWSIDVARETLETPEPACLIRELPEYRSMSEAQQRDYRLRETAAALSNLVFGEQRGALLSAQVFVDSAEERPRDAQFLGILITEEARHFQALDRYLKEKLGIAYEPHPSMRAIFRTLQEHPVWELKLIVGQVLFEPTACSMLHALLSRAEEPLLSQLIRRIMRDEARHLAFSYSVAGDLVRRFERAAQRDIEDLLFESTVACLDSFLPDAMWREAELPLVECRRRAVEALQAKGIVSFFARVMPEQLARHGFASPRLRALVEESMIPRLVHGGGA